MKKMMIAAAAMTLGASMAFAGMGINWSAGAGWAVTHDGDLEGGPGVADNNNVLWQLIYAGADNTANEPSLTTAGYVTGDDQVLADREIAAGGSTATDGTEWDGWLMLQSGTPVYEDLGWSESGAYVYQRIFEGTPAEGSWYYETDIYQYNSAYAGGGQAPDSFYYDANGNGIAMNKQFPTTPVIPEPATMSLLGLGALAMVIRRKLSK